MSIRFKTLAELKRLLDNKEISSYELVNETFKNISSSKTNSFITLDEEAALNKAKDFDITKMISARCAEKIAIKFYTNLREEPQDCSIQQIHYDNNFY